MSFPELSRKLQGNLQILQIFTVTFFHFSSFALRRDSVSAKSQLKILVGYYILPESQKPKLHYSENVLINKIK